MIATLLSIEQIATLLGVPRADAWQLACSPGFPAPAAEHSGRPVWFCEDVLAWQQAHP